MTVSIGSWYVLPKVENAAHYERLQSAPGPLTDDLVVSAVFAWTHVYEIEQRLAPRKATHKTFELVDILNGSCANEHFG